MSSEYAIRVEGLSKCYHVYDTPRDRLRQFVVPRAAAALGMERKSYFREFWALRSVSFDVRRGESVGILGRNGSGKSTLLQLITGTLTPTNGSVQASGRVCALLELGSGFNPEFTGRENVYLSGALQGYTAREMDNRFDEIASFADIGSFMDLPVKTYSSGMYARLAFSSAIHSSPDILIVDEILAVGDTAFQHKCMKKLYRIMDDGVSVLLVSHDAYQVRSICQKALLLQSGEQKFFGSSQQAMDRYVASFDSPAGEEEPTKKTANAGDISSGGEGRGQALAVSIGNVSMETDAGVETDVISSGDPVVLEFEYELHGSYGEGLSFVVNLYRDDGVYVFGTTTKMRGIDAYPAAGRGRVTVRFDELPLVAGTYKWRVAVNDGPGLHIMAEAVPVCPFTVDDNFRAVGLVDIKHGWSHTPLEA